jgi:7-dehydrocholesterol reductase
MTVKNKSLGATLKPILPITLSPLLIFLLWHINIDLHGSLGALLDEFSSQGFASTLLHIVGPNFFGSPTVWTMIASYGGIQLLFIRVLPGKLFRGPATPKGEIPVYKANGFLAFLLTVGLFLGGSYGLNLFPASILYDHFGELIGAMNLFGLLFCLLLYFKGRFAPSGPDRNLTGHFFLDYYWGTELYPKILGWSVKLVTNCRFGIMGWSLIVLSCAAKQIELSGLSDSMVVSVAIQLVCITRFFYWETGYLQSIDIIHDRAGFYICWGCLVWIPFFYTSAAVYLVQHPNHLGMVPAFLILALGVGSIACGFVADNQRHRARATRGKTRIWGRPAQTIIGHYIDDNGERKSNVLLVSGFWGIARHFHYVPEILEGFFWTLPALFGSAVPYFYLIFVTALLVGRASRDDKRCALKYGADWDEYRRRVPYKIIPGLI